MPAMNHDSVSELDTPGSVFSQPPMTRRTLLRSAGVLGLGGLCGGVQISDATATMSGTVSAGFVARLTIAV